MNYKFFLRTYLVLLSFLLASCSDFKPLSSSPQILGTGYVVTDGTIFYVEIDSVRYAIKDVLTSTEDGQELDIKAPIENMQVTCYTLSDDETVYFIAGDLDEKQIELLYGSNYDIITIPIILFFCLIFGIKIYHNIQDKRKKNHKEVEVIPK